MNSENRFFQQDQSKWIKRLNVGPQQRTLADLNRKYDRVGFWTFDPTKDHRVAKLQGHYVDVFQALDGLREHKQSAAKAGRLTPMGVTEAVAERAMVKAIPAVRRARAAVDAIKADIQLRLDGMKIAVDPEKEKQAEKIRDMLLSKTHEERNEIVRRNRHDPDFTKAIATAPEYLTGVGTTVYQNIRNEVLEREHGETLAELRDLAEPLSVVEKLAGAAREEIRDVMGVDRKIFEQVASVAERNNGQLPFRVDRERDIHGNDIEVARVLDLNTGDWRRATGTEVEQSATNSAGLAA